MMKVYGHEISEEILEKAICEMCKYFSAGALVESLVDLGVPRLSDKDLKWGHGHKGHVAHRAADRFLQRERKKGRIWFDGMWGFNKDYTNNHTKGDE